MVEAYWNIGKMIYESQGSKDRADYGDYLIKYLSEKLSKEFGKGFDKSNLKRMRQFYLTFKNGDSLRHQLSWTHYRLLLKVSEEEITKLEQGLQPGDIIKDPYVLEFLNLKGNIKFTEKELESDLIDNLQDFLLELGKLTHQDIGQMDFYVRYYEKEMKTETDNPTIGIVLCSEKNEAMVKYSVLEESKQIFASKYMLYMPTEEELIREISKERERFELEEAINFE